MFIGLCDDNVCIVGTKYILTAPTILCYRISVKCIAIGVLSVHVLYLLYNMKKLCTFTI